MQMILTIIAWCSLMVWLFMFIALGQWLWKPLYVAGACLGAAALLTAFQHRQRARNGLPHNLWIDR